MESHFSPFYSCSHLSRDPRSKARRDLFYCATSNSVASNERIVVCTDPCQKWYRVHQDVFQAILEHHHHHAPGPGLKCQAATRPGGLQAGAGGTKLEGQHLPLLQLQLLQVRCNLHWSWYIVSLSVSVFFSYFSRCLSSSTDLVH